MFSIFFGLNFVKGSCQADPIGPCRTNGKSDVAVGFVMGPKKKKTILLLFFEIL